MAKTSGVWSVLALLVAMPWVTGCFDDPSFGPNVADVPQTSPQSRFGAKLLDGKVVRAQGKVAPVAGGTLLVTKDGHAVASDPDRDQVYVVDVGAKLVATVPLAEGDEPGRVVEGPAGTVYVAARRGGVVAVVDIAKATATRVPVCAAPRGLAYEESTSSLFVACRSGLLARIDTTSHEVKERHQLDGDLRDVLVSGDNLLVSRFKNAELLVVARDGSVLRRSAPKLSNGTALTPRVAYRTLQAPNGSVLVGHVDSSNVQLPSGAGAYYGSPCGGSVADLAVSVLDPNDPGATASPEPTIKTQSSQAMGGVGGPMDLAFTADGSRVAILATGNSWAVRGNGQRSPNLFIAGAEALQGNNLGLTCSGATGATTAVTAAGEPVAVAFDEGNNWIVQSRQPAQLQTQSGAIIPLAMDDRTDTGMQMFHMNTGGGISCQSCHPEASEDGHTWNFTVGPRRSQDLRGGASARAPFHWSGDLVDFDHLFDEVMMKRMSLAADVSPEQRGALRDWLDTVPAEVTADDLDAEAVERGRALFFDQEVACGSCHGGADYSDNLAHDVGTGGVFVTPSLVGVNTRAPLFHDGCSPTLTGRFGPCGGGDLHGKTSHLTDSQRDDLVMFMRSL